MTSGLGALYNPGFKVRPSGVRRPGFRHIFSKPGSPLYASQNATPGKTASGVSHPRLAFLYVSASLCWVGGRIEAAVGYSDSGQTVVDIDYNEGPFGIPGGLGGA